MFCICWLILLPKSIFFPHSPGIPSSRMVHVYNPLATEDVCSSLQHTVRQLQHEILIHVKLKLGARAWFASRNGERRRSGSLPVGWSVRSSPHPEAIPPPSPLHSWARWCNSSLWQQSRSCHVLLSAEEYLNFWHYQVSASSYNSNPKKQLEYSGTIPFYPKLRDGTIYALVACPLKFSHCIETVGNRNIFDLIFL